MVGVIFLLGIPVIEAGIGGIYWTVKREEFANLPLKVVMMKNDIKWEILRGVGVELGNLYISPTCKEELPSGDSVRLELGGNCFNIGGMYKRKINWVTLFGGIGYMRIDIAGIFVGELMGVEGFEIVDETRNGGIIKVGGEVVKEVGERFGKVKARVGLVYGIVKDGSFREIGMKGSWYPFSGSWVQYLGVTLELSRLTLGISSEESKEMGIEKKSFPYFLLGVEFKTYQEGERSEEGVKKRTYRRKKRRR